MESLAEHVAAFQRDGYRYIPGLFDERRICEVKYYLTMNLDALLESIRDGTCEPKVRTGHFPDRFLAREPLAGFWQDNAATDGLFSLIYPCGYNLSGFAPTARFLLPGYLAAQWPPHSDDQYGPFVGKHFVTLWIPLTPIDQQHGGLCIHDGAQRIRYDMQPGDALIFRSNVVHETMPNTSENVRLSLDGRFFAR